MRIIRGFIKFSSLQEITRKLIRADFKGIGWEISECICTPETDYPPFCTERPANRGTAKFHKFNIWLSYFHHECSEMFGVFPISKEYKVQKIQKFNSYKKLQQFFIGKLEQTTN